MAKRKHRKQAEKEASEVMDAMFGHLPRWDEGVARAQDAFQIAAEVHALRERHGLTLAALAALAMLATRVGTSSRQLPDWKMRRIRGTRRRCCGGLWRGSG